MHTTFNVKAHIWALWAAVLLNLLTWAYNNGKGLTGDFDPFHFNKQYEIPQGVVLCQSTGPTLVLGGKDNYTPQEWDYIQHRAYEAMEKCK